MGFSQNQRNLFKILEHREAELLVENISLNFGGIAALVDIGFQIRTGELVSIIGPNGAGKTSLLNTLTGFYVPVKGKITFNNQIISGLKPNQISKIGISRTFQNIELFNGMSVLKNILLGRHLFIKYNLLSGSLFLPFVKNYESINRQIINQVIDFLGLQSIQEEPIDTLPYGLRKKVELGRALALEPKLMILDEPFAGMTFEEKEDMVNLLKQLNNNFGLTIILVEHDIPIIMDISKRIIVLNFGQKIAEGIPEDIQNHPDVIKAYLGANI